MFILPLIAFALASGTVGAETDDVRWLGRALVMTSSLDEASAFEHAEAAHAAATEIVPVRLVLAVAWVESRYDPYTVSRVVHGHRKAGRWTKDYPTGTGLRYCGVLQAKAFRKWKKCLALRDISLGYAAGVAELEAWWKTCGKKKYRGRDRVRCMLEGHAHGNRGARRAYGRYSFKVLKRLKRLRRKEAKLRLEAVASVRRGFPSSSTAYGT